MKLRQALLRIARLLGVGAICVALVACNYYGAPVTGRVLQVANFGAPADQWQFAPIADAEILVLWRGYQSSLVHGGSLCFKKEYVRSDAQGNFRVNGWKMQRTVGGVSDILPITYVYAPGFVELSSNDGKNEIFLRNRDEPVNHVLRAADTVPDPEARSNRFVNSIPCPTTRLARGESH
jgi:hypothetical protein